MQVNIESTPQLVAERFAADLSLWINESSEKFHIALSGGSTPKILFRHWTEHSNAIDWEKVHFYWGDERCVPPDHTDSNYGVTNNLFFQPAGIPATNIHRVLGESDPETEAIRYSQIIQGQVGKHQGLPQFDVVMLGMGSDGHTASIFPDQMQLMDDDRVCGVAVHPETGQRRVTLNGKTIANAKRIAFLITGESKKEKFAGIKNQTEESNLWPATRFMQQSNATVYMDQNAIG